MKIETKLSVGDIAYYFENNKIIKDEIKKIIITATSADEDRWYAEYYFYKDPEILSTHKNFDVNEIFATKEDLVKNLIKDMK